MPARHKKSRLLKRRGDYSRGKRLNWGRILVFLIIFIASLGLLVVLTSRRFWNGKDKMILAVSREDGGVSLAIFDPKVQEINEIFIPAEVEIEVAKNLGLWRLKSIWTLGENQDKGGGGLLLTRSITKYLKFPVYVWADSEALGFVKGSPRDLLKAVFSKYDTNLKFADRIFIGLFSLSVSNPKRQQISLSDTPFLRKTLLADGIEGYKVYGNSPQGIASLFVYEQESDSSALFKIIDESGEIGTAQELTQIIESLGGKVASISREKESDVGCFISGKKVSIVEKLTLLLPCQKGGVPEGNFDYEVRIGKDFVKQL